MIVSDCVSLEADLLTILCNLLEGAAEDAEQENSRHAKKDVSWYEAKL